MRAIGGTIGGGTNERIIGYNVVSGVGSMVETGV